MNNLISQSQPRHYRLKKTLLNLCTAIASVPKTQSIESINIKYIPLVPEDTALRTVLRAHCGVAKPRRGLRPAYVLRLALHPVILALKSSIFRYEGYRSSNLLNLRRAVSRASQTFAPVKYVPLKYVLVLALASSALTGCAPLLFGGAVVGTSVAATDRRTVGIQVEDKSIALKAASRVNEQFGDRVHVNITAYNRRVLLTGEVPDQKTKNDIEKIVANVENVKNLVNDLEIAGLTSLTSRSNDTLITGKVKASLLDAKDVYANAFKVVTERSQVYLIGRVTQREGDQAAEIARQVSGVQKVIKMFDYITEEELKTMLNSRIENK